MLILQSYLVSQFHAFCGIVFALLARGLWSMDYVYMIDSNGTVPMSGSFVVLSFQSVPVIFLLSLLEFRLEKQFPPSFVHKSILIQK